MPGRDIIDEIFIVAAPEIVRLALCDTARWHQWFPDLDLTTYEDRGPLGVRWRVSGAITGTAEVWLEQFGDGVIAHVYVREDDRSGRSPGQTGRRRRRAAKGPTAAYAFPLKRHLTAVKDALEVGRPPGVPRVPLSERVVSPPKQTTVRRKRHSTRARTTLSAKQDAKGLREMANETTSSILIEADPASVMAVIADFDGYPAWAKGVKSASVLTEYDDGRAGEVAFVLDAAPIKDEYTLSYDWDDDTAVRWSLVEAKMLKAMEGAYELHQRPGGTDVTYRLAVELSIPMIGMLRRKGEKVIIDTALKGLKKQVESRG